ncbi:MAG: hypothetical protein RLZZ15_1202 [Verrucomicrobiota bacterium]|jgi:adenosylhomocysteine nucleosidase
MTRLVFLRLIMIFFGALALPAAAPVRPLYAVCGAYEPELVALKKAFGVDAQAGWKSTTINGLEFWSGACAGRDAIVFRTGVSVVNAAYQLQLALDKFPITHVLFAGVAGGTDPALAVGDVVIPERWAYHSEAAYLNEDGRGGYVRPDYLPLGRGNFGMMFPTGVGVVRADGTTERQEFFAADAALLAVARRVAAKLPPQTRGGRAVRVEAGGTGVSGPVFLDNAPYREWVFRTWQARCVDMESTALAHVAQANAKPILIVRGLSDLAGGQPGKNPIGENELSVAELAARVLRAVVAEL